MKHITKYKLFESHKEMIPLFHDIFQELKDDGFNVNIREACILRLDFSKAHVVSVNNSTFNLDLLTDQRLNVIEVLIGNKLNRFSIGDIIEVLKFAESYIKEELKYTIENIYIQCVPKYTYYKSLNCIPKDKSIDSISVYFKNESVI